MSKRASTAQISYIRDLAERAGYTGDRGYNAAADLLGEGRRWNETSEQASRLIDALKAKLGISAAPSTARQYQPIMGRCRDCGAPGHVDERGLGFDCGCAAE